MSTKFIPYILEPPKSIIYDPVVVMDFQSFYPSIMISHNICYSTLLCVKDRDINCEKKFKVGFTENLLDLSGLKLDDLIVTKNGACFVKKKIRKGIIPKLMQEFFLTRIMLKKNKKKYSKSEYRRKTDNQQKILKLFMNVMYGYTAAGFSGKMPCSEIADAVVSTARKVLFKTIKKVQKLNKNFQIIYGDT